MTYLTKPGEMLDLIVWRRYGRQAGAVEQVMAANPALGVTLSTPVLPPRTPLLLPDALTEAAAPPAAVRLWD